MAESTKSMESKEAEKSELKKMEERLLKLESKSVNGTEVAKKTDGEISKLFVRAKINGLQFRKCLIDTGSECNMISVKMATQHSLPYTRTEVKGIKGFNSQIYDDIEGEMEVDLSFGPTGATKKAMFYVVPGCPSPLVGLPTLVDFELLIDVADRKITEKKTGKIIGCSVTNKFKENQPKAKKAKTAKESKASASDEAPAPTSKN